MQQNKAIIYLAITAVILLVVYILLQQRSVPTQVERQLVEIDTALVEEVSIFKDGSTTTLTRTDEGWMVTSPFEYAANGSFIKTLLKKLEDLRIETEVTRKKDRWEEFELDDDQATRVTVTVGGKKHDFRLGKAASGYKQTYASLEGEDTVYLIRGTYGVAVNRKAESWREKKIARFEADQISRYITDEYEMVREGDDWRVNPKRGESFIAEQVKARKVTSNLKNLRTSDFPEPDEYKGINWDNPWKESWVELTTGETHHLRFYRDPGDENRYFLRYDDRPTVFRVYKGMVGQLFKEVEELKTEPEDKNIVR